VENSKYVRRLLRKDGLNSPCCFNRLMRAAAYACAVRPPWRRPRHQHRRCPTPTAGRGRTPGTFGISAWLRRSESRRHLRCREERTGRDPRRDRRHSHASPHPRRLVAAGEGLGSCYSSATPPFLLVGPRRDSGVIAPRLPRISRGWAPAITANTHLCPRLPVPAEPLLAATRTPTGHHGHSRGKAFLERSLGPLAASCEAEPSAWIRGSCTALRRVAEDPADAPHR
jgi:hypothetical protein